MEITARSLRLAAVADHDSKHTVLSTLTVDLPAGSLEESYAALNIQDEASFADVLLKACSAMADITPRRAAVSLPDSVFRVQLLDFDELPPGRHERERLVRWRLEKTAAFDMADTLLRFEVRRKTSGGLSLLACTAKRTVIEQYEKALKSQGLEPWVIGPSSFHAMNLYRDQLAGLQQAYAFIYTADDAVATLVVEGGHLQFYRHKDLKRGSSAELASRMVREVSDSLHYYAHSKRPEQQEVGRVFIAGHAPSPETFRDGLRSASSLETELMTPSMGAPADGTASEVPPMMSAAIGAGVMV